MTQKSIQISPSGIHFVDNHWGGFYTGGTYIIHGPQKSGRTSLGLQFALQPSKDQKVCIYFTNMRPRNLIIQAESIGLDIQSQIRTGQLVVVEVPSQKDLVHRESPDAYITEFLEDLVAIVDEYDPTHLVFDELTDFLIFNNLNQLSDVFYSLMEAMEIRHVTSLFITREPENPKNRVIRDMLIKMVTGHIQIQKFTEQNETKGTPESRISIFPNIGHNEGVFSSTFSIFKPAGNRSKGSLSMFELTEFISLLNNRFRHMKTTGEAYQLIAFHVNPNFRRQETMQILKESVKLAVSGDDLGCIDHHSLYILAQRNETEKLNGLLAITVIVKDLIPDISVIMVPVSSAYKNAEALVKMVQEHFKNNAEQRPQAIAK